MNVSLNKLRILLVGPIPPPAGGMANQTRQLKKLLESSGASVQLVAVNRPYAPRFMGKVPIIRAIFRLTPYFADLYRETKKADVVHLMANSGWSWHLFAVPAIWIAHWLNVPILVNYRGGHAEPFFAKSWKKVKMSLDKASHIIVPSDYLKGVFEKYQKRADVVPNVLNDKLFFAPETISQIDVDYGPTLLVTRNLEKIYDLPTAIKCLSNVKKDFPNARLVIAGTGPELLKLNELTESLHLVDSVSFLGRVDIEDIARLYKEADVLLNPSTVDNSPNSVIEALASGCPVVTTDVGGIPLLVKHNVDALMIPPQNPTVMAQNVLKVLNDDELRLRLVSQGIKSVARFHWTNVSQRLEAAYTFASQQTK